MSSDRIPAGLQAQVHAALEHSPYLTRKKLRCETHAGRVTLHGHVASYFEKQMATEVLRKLQGVQEIENCLEVTWR